MKPDRFKELLDELDGNSLQTLKEKNARYAKDGDCLHNFRSGAEVAGGTPAQVCWGYMTKHLVALRDMVERNDFSNREDFLEKCQDTINYIRFLWCIGNDEMTRYTQGVEPEKSESKNDPNKHEQHILFSDINAANTFMNYMENLLTINRVITKVDVWKYLKRWYELEDYTFGWTSTNCWVIKEDCLNGEVELILPPPVNI